MEEKGQHAAGTLARWMCQISVVVLVAVGGFGTGFAQSGAANRAARSAQAAKVENYLGQGYRDLKSDRYSDAVREFKAALRLEPGLVLRARFPLAVGYFELHELKEARKEFEAVRSATGNRPDTLYYLGRINLEEGNYAGAVEDLAKASSTPPFPDTAYYLGLAYFKNGDLSQAEQWLLRARQLGPQDYRVPEELARLYQREGREKEAKKALLKAGQLEGRDNMVSRERIDCIQALEDSSLERARPVCEKLFDPQDAQELALLGTIYGQHGDYGDALAPLRRAAELEPDSPPMQYNLALDYFRLRRYAEARARLERVTKRWPDLFEPNALLGVVLYRLGENAAAYQELRHAHELNPQDSGTAGFLYEVSLALARQSLGKRQNAAGLRYLKTAAGLQPDNPNPHRLMAQIYNALGERQQAAAENRKAERLSAPNVANTQ